MLVIAEITTLTFTDLRIQLFLLFLYICTVHTCVSMHMQASNQHWVLPSIILTFYFIIHLFVYLSTY